MRIGVFGDSYAEKDANADAWWQRLIHDHNHDVVSYGVSASSIPFSMTLLEQFAAQHDFNIWCFTTPGRFSVPMHNTGFFHSADWINTTGDLTAGLDGNNGEVIKVCQRYLKYVFDLKYENFVATLIANHFLEKMPNLMIIPCFDAPLFTKFNLYGLCSLEIQTIFPGRQTHEIYKKYQDIRVCHLTKKNNKILAHLINEHLVQGIFQADYENFDFRNIDVNEILVLS